MSSCQCGRSGDAGPANHPVARDRHCSKLPPRGLAGQWLTGLTKVHTVPSPAHRGPVLCTNRESILGRRKCLSYAVMRVCEPVTSPASACLDVTRKNTAPLGDVQKPASMKQRRPGSRYHRRSTDPQVRVTLAGAHSRQSGAYCKVSRLTLYEISGHLLPVVCSLRAVSRQDSGTDPLPDHSIT
jgi:hypothetical protein